jgi:L-ascorbate metabolism protein UlaG (beta-lactamase superfamily)
MTDRIEVFTQNSIRIRAELGNIYVDPFQMRESPKDADFILITHDHYDHFSPEDIRKVAGKDCVLIVPEKMEGKAKEVGDCVRAVRTVAPGASYEIEGLKLETLPAYNALKPFHPKSAGWVGYVLELEGQRIYIAGDTDATKEAEAVKCDVALVPIGGTYTMNAKKAAELINRIRPACAIPTHYGGIVGSAEDAEVFAAAVKPPVAVEIKLQY